MHTLDDFLLQLRRVRRMGSFQDLLGMIPGFESMEFDTHDEQFKSVEAMICSMTAAERRAPNSINQNRKKRIAIGSGTTVSDVSRLIVQFNVVARQFSSFNINRDSSAN